MVVLAVSEMQYFVRSLVKVVRVHFSPFMSFSYMKGGVVIVLYGGRGEDSHIWRSNRGSFVHNVDQMKCYSHTTTYRIKLFAFSMLAIVPTSDASKQRILLCSIVNCPHGGIPNPCTVVKQFQSYVDPDISPVPTSTSSAEEGESVTLPLGEMTLTHNLGVPVIVVCSKVSVCSLAVHRDVDMCGCGCVGGGGVHVALCLM